MKKGPLNFLGRKNQSLFDTNVKMKDMDSVELVLGSGTILESGTASVRARPTVKHYSPSTDGFQAFAVPTPTVPLYAQGVNGTKFNGSVSDDQSSNGSTISVNDPFEGEILVPPPPSMAPPPPPEGFVLPPPEFMGDLSTLQPPPMPAPKPPSKFVFMQEDDFSFMTPPPMSPPKAPSTGSSGPSTMHISSPLSPKVPEHPKYAAPQPPTEKQRTFKSPPPKPIRISSVQSTDSPPSTPAPPPPVHTPTLSTFNPQSPAKLYSAPKTTFLNGYEEQSPKTKPKLLLQDSGAGPTVQKDANVPTKPTTKYMDTQGVRDVKQDIPKPVLQVQEIETVPMVSVPAPPSTPPEPIRERKPITAATLKEFSKASKMSSIHNPQEAKTEQLHEPDGSSTLNGKYSPLIDRKLRNISGPSAPKDTSPLALLMAAKQRDRHRPTHDNTALSRSSLASTSSGSSLSLNSTEPESPKPPEPVYATVKKSPVKSMEQSAGSLFPNQRVQEASPVKPNPPVQVDESKPNLDVPFLPPPPEFDDFEDIEPPPAMRPPDPPKIAPTPLPPTPPKTPAPKPPAAPFIPTPPKPAPAPVPAPPPVPQLPPVSLTKTKPPPVQAKPKPVQAPLPTPSTPSQVTLLNILKKKMMEMDHKMDPDVSEPDSSLDDWGSPEDNPVPVIPKVNSPQNIVVNKPPGVDMNELQSKVAQKNQEMSPNRIPIPTSDGPSRHQYGMTFTVRPGTKQPITLVRKGES